MLTHNPKLKRVVLDHDQLASESDIARLKSVVSSEMSKRKATRGLIRVLASKRIEDNQFETEACVPTGKGFLTYLALNSPSRLPSDETFQREADYTIAVISGSRRPMAEFEIVRLNPDAATAREISGLLSETYSSYPVPLDPDSLAERLRNSIPYAVLHEGRIISSLFGSPMRYGELDTVEFTFMASRMAGKKKESAIPMTTALAMRIAAEARERFDEPLMLAETIAGPVMRSCHDLGMSFRGMLREHYQIGIGERTYTNFYLWSL